MGKKDFLEEKYLELNHLKNLLQTYPKDYCDTIIQVMNRVCEEISQYLENEKEKMKNIIKENVRQNFTIDEIAKYNGKNGMPAYVLVNGTVYDVTGLPAWENGGHFGLNASQDLSKQFKGCHANNLSIIERAKVVGTLIDSKNSRDELKNYTVDEVARFDGQDGRSAYIIVSGLVYDVTNIKAWSQGKHYGVTAGKDVTNYFETCHHNEKEKLNKLTVVGSVVEK